jgi:type II secretory pathway pseudopilin PulG
MLCHQRGQALIAITVLLGITLLVTVYTITGSVNQASINNQKTADALAQAKAALIGYATAATPNGSDLDVRPGDLPCPDNHPVNDLDVGMPTTPCSSNALGRLPWKFLGLPDLRDGSGERLWYAVSSNYKNNPRTPELNSDTYGTITVRDSNGTVVNNGTNSTAAIAVVIAPGSPLTRQDGITQNHTESGYTDPKNYLDIANGEDNAEFSDNSPVDGFIQGEIRDSNGNIILNDKLIPVTYGDLMPLIEKRVAGELGVALNIFHADPTNLTYPYAALDRLGSCPIDDEDDGGLGVNPVAPPPCSSPAPDYPAWISGAKWYQVVHYHKISDDKARLSLDPDPSKPTTCTGSFLITWQGTQGTIKRELPCVP